jgi:cytochrome c-type biogenesis protein CcmH/NrfG
MELVVYPLLKKESQRAMRRTKRRYGHPYYYTPQARLVRRLANQLGKTEDEIKEQIALERKFLLQYKQYF